MTARKAATGGDKRPRGRPAYAPSDGDRRKVEQMAAYNLKHDAIAAIMGISDETLRKYYGPELEHGKSKIVAAVANALVARALSATDPSGVNAAKFFLQSQAGWIERASHEHTGKDGAPLVPVINVSIGGTEPSPAS
ncbi:MAG: hypothetical protein AB7O04_07340 [Hyphomonadaceae bacterium]